MDRPAESVGNDPWILSISRHFSYLGHNIRLSRDFFRRLVSASILSFDDYDFFAASDDAKDRDKMVDHLLSILRRQPPNLFEAFCGVLRDVGSGDIAQCLLTGQGSKVDAFAGKAV